MRETTRKLITLSKYRRAAEQRAAERKDADDAVRDPEDLRESMLDQMRAALAEAEASGQTVNREPLRTDYEERYGI